MLEIFTKHPDSVGESYVEHAKFAMCCGIKLIILGSFAIIHGIFPFLFEKTASNGVTQLRDCFINRNQDK